MNAVIVIGLIAEHGIEGEIAVDTCLISDISYPVATPVTIQVTTYKSHRGLTISHGPTTIVTGVRDASA